MGRPQEYNEERDRLYRESLTATPLFTGASFDCFMARSSLKFLTNGELSVTFIVDPMEVDNALCLRHLATNPAPLRLEVTVREEFVEEWAEAG